MSLNTRGFLRQLILVAVCALGTLGILASGSSGSGSDNGGGDFFCGLSIQGIATATDVTGDIWVGVLSKTAEGDYHSVSRLRSDGTEKASYAFGYAPGENLVKVVAIATEGFDADKVYVGGDFAGGILRLKENGLVDENFRVGVGFDGRVSSIVPATDGTGDIYVGGSFSNYDTTLNISGLVRLHDDGSLDSTGFVGAGASGIESIALAIDPLPLLTGYLYTGGVKGVDRWNNGGIKDPGFTSLVAPTFTVTAADDGSGAIYVGGTASLGVARLNVLGFRDVDFDTNIGTGFDADILSIVRADDMTDDIYAGGRFTVLNGVPARGIVRLQSNGSKAVGFSISDGFANSPSDPDPLSQVYSLARATDGTIDIYVSGGFALYNGVRSNGIARLNADGSLDGDFAVEIAAEKGLCTNNTIPGLD